MKTTEKTKKELLKEIEQLKDSQNNLSAVFNNTQDLQLLAKYEGTKKFRVVAVNNSYLKRVFQFGIKITEKDLIGKSLKELLLDILFLDQAVYDYTIDYYQKAIDTHKQVIYNESIVINKQPFHSKTSYNPINNSVDGLRFVLYNSHDITIEKESNQFLQSIKERFDLAISASKDGIYDWNLISNEIYYSPAWKNMLGYEDNELPNDFSIWESLTEPEDVERSWIMQQKLINKEVDRFELEFKMKHKDGHWIDVLSRADAVFDKNGKAIRIVGTHIDISDSKKANQIIESNKNRLDFALKINEIGTWELDLKTMEAWRSLNHDQIFGYEELLPKWTFDMTLEHIVPEDREKVKEKFQNSISTKTDWNFECRINSIDGGIRWIMIKGKPETNEDGEAVKMFGVVQDITSKKELEKTLIESEAKYKLIAENASDVVWIIDLETSELIYVSHSIKRQRGYSQEEALAQKLIDYLTPDSYEYLSSKAPERMERFKQGIREDFVDELEQTCKDGSTIWTEVKARYIRNNRNNRTEIIGVTRDISAQKKHQQEIVEAKEKAEENEEKLDLALNGAGAGLWDWNIKTGEDLLDERWCGILGYKKEEIEQVVGSWEKLIHPDDKERIMDVVNKHFVDEKNEFNSDYRMKCKNGEWKWIHAMGKVVKRDAEGGPARMSGIIIDIDDRKHSEIELNDAKIKAEESDRIKSAFLANMSHEIRTPMNGILGFTSLLKNVDLTEDKHQKFIGIIEKSGARMLNTINDIIDISRIESGEVKTTIKQTNINSQLKSLYDFFKPEALKKNIILNFNPGLDNTSAAIQTDPEKIDAIFINLIKNAIKFTNEGYIEFGYSQIDTKIHFYVKDTGDGIQADKLEHIFERFIQEDMSNSSRYQGSGLGLSIVKAYVELLGGKIWVESKKDVGSTFHITIPYNVIEKHSSSNKMIAKGSMVENNKISGKTILIAEDDDTSFEFLKIINLGFGIKTILWAKNGEEAIKICKENLNIDLVLMDINMPVMNGYKATEAIKKLNPHLPIIAQTAYAISGDREKSLEAGCDDYITKPINEEDLLEKYEKYLN